MFRRVIEEERVARTPVIEVIRQQPVMIILTALCRMAEQAPFYVFVAFIFTYGTTVLHTSRDFLLYVQVAPLVFAKLFFPHSDPLVGTMEAFGIYAVGFVSRPIGAALFGHYGDRLEAAR